MKFSSFVLVSSAFTGIALAGTLDFEARRMTPWKRDATTVLTDLQKLDTDVKQANTDCNAYTGTSSQALTVNKDFNNVQNDVKQAITDCQNTVATSVTAQQATNIINYCNSPLEPDIKSTLTCLKNKKATFTTAGLKSTVQSQLKALQTNSSTLTNCLLSKTPTAQKAAASSCVNKITADIQDAVNFYAT